MNHYVQDSLADALIGTNPFQTAGEQLTRRTGTPGPSRIGCLTFIYRFCYLA